MAELAARVAAAATAGLVGERGMGAYADCLPAADTEEFAGELACSLGRPFRVAFLGWGARPAGDSPSGWTFSATVANAWRNDASTRSGIPLVVAASGARAKLRSLRSTLPLLTEGDLRATLASQVVAWLDTPGRRALWAALASMPDRFPLSRLIAFAAEAESQSGSHALPRAETRGMHRLGLLADPDLQACRGEALASRALERNHDLVQSLRPLSRRHLLPLATASHAGDPAAKALLMYAETGSAAALGDVTYRQALELLRPLERAGAPAVRPLPDCPMPVEPAHQTEVRVAAPLGSQDMRTNARVAQQARGNEAAPDYEGALNSIVSRLVDAAPYLRFGVDVVALGPSCELMDALTAVAARRAEADGCPFNLRALDAGGATAWPALADRPAHLSVFPFGAVPAEELPPLCARVFWLALAGAPSGFRVPGLIALHAPAGWSVLTSANGLALRLAGHAVARGGLIPDEPTLARTLRQASETGIDPFPRDEAGCHSLVRTVAAAEWLRARLPGGRLAPAAAPVPGVDVLECRWDADRHLAVEFVLVTAADGFRHSAAGAVLSPPIMQTLETLHQPMFGGGAAKVIAVDTVSLGEPESPSFRPVAAAGPWGLPVECFRIVATEASPGRAPETLSQPVNGTCPGPVGGRPGGWT